MNGCVYLSLLRNPSYRVPLLKFINMVRKKTNTQKDLSIIPSEFDGEDHSDDSKHNLDEISVIQEEAQQKPTDVSENILTGSAAKPILPGTQLVSGKQD